MVSFQLILASTGSGLLCQSRGFLNCIKGTHPLWWQRYRIAGLGGALNCFSPVNLGQLH